MFQVFQEFQALLVNKSIKVMNIYLNNIVGDFSFYFFSEKMIQNFY